MSTYSNKNRIGVYETGTPYERKRGDIPTFRGFHRLLRDENIAYFVDIKTGIEYIIASGNKAYYAFSNNPKIRKNQSHPTEGDKVLAKKYFGGKVNSPVLFSFTIKEVYYDRKWKSGLVFIELPSWSTRSIV